MQSRTWVWRPFCCSVQALFGARLSSLGRLFSHPQAPGRTGRQRPGPILGLPGRPVFLHSPLCVPPPQPARGVGALGGPVETQVSLGRCAGSGAHLRPGLWPRGAKAKHSQRTRGLWRTKGPHEWARGLEPRPETGELAGWAGIGFLLISPASRSLGPNWGAVSAEQRGREDETRSRLRKLPGCEHSPTFLRWRPGGFSPARPRFLGHRWLPQWPPAQEDRAFSARRAPTPAAQGQARAGDRGLCRRGDPQPPTLRPTRAPG